MPAEQQDGHNFILENVNKHKAVGYNGVYFEYLKIHISAKISITISLMRTYLDIDIGIGDSKYEVVFHFPNVMCMMTHFNYSTRRTMIFRNFTFYLPLRLNDLMII